MSAIWKYPLKAQDLQEVQTPDGAQFIAAQVQNGQICLWAIVEPTLPKVWRVIRIIGTGHEFDAMGLDHIGSVQLHGGTLVFHVFEESMR